MLCFFYCKVLLKDLGLCAISFHIISSPMYFQKNEKLYIQLLDIEYQKQPVSVPSVLEIFNRAINSDDVVLNTKIKMSQRRLEFLEDFGSSILQ